MALGDILGVPDDGSSPDTSMPVDVGPSSQDELARLILAQEDQTQQLSPLRDILFDHEVAGDANVASPPIPVNTQQLPSQSNGNMDAYAAAIAKIESGGRYDLVGPMANGSGDQALGKYQVMRSNVPEWTHDAVGRSLSPQEFLQSPDAQELVFRSKFGQSIAKYGNASDAASVWFSGQPLSVARNRADVLGTTGQHYVDMFLANLRTQAGIPTDEATPPKQLPQNQAALMQSYAANNGSMSDANPDPNEGQPDDTSLPNGWFVKHLPEGDYTYPGPQAQRDGSNAVLIAPDDMSDPELNAYREKGFLKGRVVKIVTPDGQVSYQALDAQDTPRGPVTSDVAQPDQPVGDEQPGVPLPEPRPVDIPQEPADVTHTDALQSFLEPLREGAAGALKQVASTPYNLLAALASVPKLVTGTEALDSSVSTLRNIADQNADLMDRITGSAATPELANLPGAKLGKLAGESLTPMGAATLPASAITAGVQGINQFLVQPALSAPRPDAAQINKDIQPIVETMGGPRVTDGQEMKTLGVMGLMTIGAIFAPGIFGKLKMGKVPSFRPVRDAMPGTKDVTTNMDYVRTADDSIAGLIRGLKRVGLDDGVITNIQDNFRMQSRSAARSLVNSAVTMGHAETPTSVFQSKVPLKALNDQFNTPIVQDYLKGLHTVDELLLAGTQNAKSKQPLSPSKVKVRGQNIKEALAVINAMEQANPQLKQIGQAYRDVLTNVRKFETTGEAATISKERNATLQQTRPNFVHVPRDTNIADVNAFQSLADYMQFRMRVRMENEVKLLTVDSTRAKYPSLFKRLSHPAKQLKANPHWQKNTVTVYRRGKAEVYSTNPFWADVLNMDPYYMTGAVAQTAYMTKRMLEMGATGWLNPFFAPVSFMYNYGAGKLTAPASGLRSPTLIGSALAIPQQLYPQIVHAWTPAINAALTRASNGWLSNVLTPQVVQGLSARLAKEWTDSLFYKMETAGSGHGTVLDQQARVGTNILTEAAKAAPPELKAVYNGFAKFFINPYQAALSAVHNAPSFNFAKRNAGTITDTTKLAMESRHMAGDPRVGGRFYTKGGKKIRIEGTNPVGAGLAKGYGFLNELGRTGSPWFNITQQSMKRVGEAYLKDPVGVTARVWLYGVMPAVASSFWNRSLGNDPNGESYADYQMNRRSDYAKTYRMYIGVPGRPVGQGIEVPRPTPPETSLAARMAEAAVDHLAGTAYFTEKEDMRNAAMSFLGATILPPYPPAIGVGMALGGVTAPQGFFGQEAYVKKYDPFDPSGGLPHSMELISRALGLGVIDILGSGYAAFSATPGDRLDKAVANAALEVTKNSIQRSPLVRDVLRMEPPQYGSSNIMEELFKKSTNIRNLENYFTKFKRGFDLSDKDSNSPSGGAIADALLGHGLSRQPGGLVYPAPTNPLFTQFAEEVYNKFRKESIYDRSGAMSGGMGFQSLWKRYSDASYNVSTMRKVNQGNYVTWQEQLAARPETLADLKSNGVDVSNINEVRSFYENRRQEAAAVILKVIRNVEAEFSQRLGQKITLEDLDPYGKGITPADGGVDSGANLSSSPYGD